MLAQEKNKVQQEMCALRQELALQSVKAANLQGKLEIMEIMTKDNSKPRCPI